MVILGLLTYMLIYLTECRKLGDQKAVTPVVMVPGIFGSQLEAWYDKESAPHYYCSKNSGGWTNLWVCIECMLPPVLSCWVDTVRLNITDVNNILNRDGVQTKVTDFGNTEGISYLDKRKFIVQYAKMIEAIDAIPGYRRGISIRGAPYDFRYGPNTEVGKLYLIKLRYLIEETYEINGKRPVMVIAHSMGNPYIINFLSTVDQAWKDKYLDSYLAISGVFGGSAKAIRATLSGETEDLPGFILDPIVMRKFGRTTPTGYWLMPPAHVWDDTPFVFANGRSYTAKEYADLLADAGVSSGMEMYNTVKDVPLFNPNIGVDVYCVHGTNQSTPYQFIYEKDGFPDKMPTTLTGNGDGTVNQKSLEICKQFKRLKDYKTVTGPLSTHLETLRNDEVLYYVVKLLVNKQSELENNVEF